TGDSRFSKIDEFSALRRRGKQLVRVEQLVWGERLPQSRHCCPIRAGEDVGHLIALFQANSVLAADGAAKLHAGAQNLVAGFESALYLIRKTAVKQQPRMKIAIAGVEDVG